MDMGPSNPTRVCPYSPPYTVFTSSSCVLKLWLILLKYNIIDKNKYLSYNNNHHVIIKRVTSRPVGLTVPKTK